MNTTGRLGFLSRPAEKRRRVYVQKVYAQRHLFSSAPNERFARYRSRPPLSCRLIRDVRTHDNGRTVFQISIVGDSKKYHIDRNALRVRAVRVDLCPKILVGSVPFSAHIFRYPSTVSCRGLHTLGPGSFVRFVPIGSSIYVAVKPLPAVHRVTHTVDSVCTTARTRTPCSKRRPLTGRRRCSRAESAVSKSKCPSNRIPVRWPWWTR